MQPKVSFMYRERIKEEKKRLGISSKTMAELSKLGVQEETISRFLTGNTADPGTSVTLDLGETVGLKPYEIFMDAVTAAEFRAYLDLKHKAEETETERITLNAELDTLRTTNTALASENDRLRTQIAYLNQLLEDKDEIIDLLKQLMSI